MNKEAIVVIPGFDAKEVGFALSRVIDKVSTQQSIAHVGKLGTPDTPNMESLEVTFYDDDSKKQIDVYEVFWADIINENYSDDQPLYKKVIFGLELIRFWFISSIWKAALKNKWMFIGVCFSGLIITLWYISILGIFASVLDESTSLLDFMKDSKEFVTIQDVSGETKKIAPKFFHPIVTQVFLGIGIIIGLIPGLIALILKVSGFTMKFIKSDLVRDDVKNRVVAQMNSIARNSEYTRVTFLAHSLGAIPTLHFLSNYQNPGGKRIRSITIGAAISFLSHKTKVFTDYFDQCAANEHIEEWADFYSREDWLCSYKSIDDVREGFTSEELRLDSSWLSRISPKVHSMYFDHSQLIEKIIKD